MARYEYDEDEDAVHPIYQTRHQHIEEDYITEDDDREEEIRMRRIIEHEQEELKEMKLLMKRRQEAEQINKRSRKERCITKKRDVFDELVQLMNECNKEFEKIQDRIVEKETRLRSVREEVVFEKLNIAEKLEYLRKNILGNPNQDFVKAYKITRNGRGKRIQWRNDKAD